jgi:hypothetical protein
MRNTLGGCIRRWCEQLKHDLSISSILQTTNQPDFTRATLTEGVPGTHTDSSDEFTPCQG